ncbi:MAG TPA: hypothetical protein VG847_08320 [Chitinophagaceae bacterium]|nr:hypothetical protein [Chitinophagaceae bacterium]
MKKFVIILLICISLSAVMNVASAQCAICAKTVAQMGDKPGRGFNSGIIYLMTVPYLAIGIIGYRWWKHNR